MGQHFKIYVLVYTTVFFSDILIIQHMSDYKKLYEDFQNFGGAPKSLQMVTKAMKLKDTYSLEEKLWPI